MNSLDTTSSPYMDDDRPITTSIPSAQRSSGAWLLLLGLLTLIVFGLAVVAGYLPRQQQQVVLQEMTRALSIPTVKVVSPTPGTIDTSLLIPAEIKAYAEAPIFARANGYLKARSVDIGSKVIAGQLLAEIDTPELRQEILQATAQLAQSEAAMTLAQTTSDRYEKLIKEGAVSVQGASEKSGDLAVKKANVEAARANLRRLEDLQSFDRVIAPFAGSITSRRVDVGDLITANGNTGTELFRLAQLDKLRVFARVPQSLIRSISIGSTAEVILADQPPKSHPAKIIRTAGSLSVESRTLLVELELDNAKAELLAGSYAQVRFTNATAIAPLTLPATTLIFRADGSQVAIVQEGKVELRSITIGRDHGASFEVLSGVTEIDKIVINPPDAMVTGSVVHISETD